MGRAKSDKSYAPAKLLFERIELSLTPWKGAVLRTRRKEHPTQGPQMRDHIFDMLAFLVAHTQMNIVFLEQFDVLGLYTVGGSSYFSNFVLMFVSAACNIFHDLLDSELYLFFSFILRTFASTPKINTPSAATWFRLPENSKAIALVKEIYDADVNDFRSSLATLVDFQDLCAEFLIVYGGAGPLSQEYAQYLVTELVISSEDRKLRCNYLQQSSASNFSNFVSKLLKPV